MTEVAALGGLFVSAFVSATVLPGSSELVLAGILLRDPTVLWPAVWLATLGNTLGGMTSYLMGRVLPAQREASRQVGWLQRWGSPALLLSWVPVIGDALCVAAGWLRIHAGWAAAFLALGKFTRYWVLSKAIAGL